MCESKKQFYGGLEGTLYPTTRELSELKDEIDVGKQLEEICVVNSTV